MADEIQINASVSATKGNVSISRGANTSLDMSGEDVCDLTQLIGTTAETVGLGEISGAPAEVMIENLDAANFVEIGGDSGLTVFKLKIPAGSFALFSPSSGTVYAKADTASVRVRITAIEA